MKRKILAIFLICCMMLTILPPLPALAEMTTDLIDGQKTSLNKETSQKLFDENGDVTIASPQKMSLLSNSLIESTTRAALSMNARITSGSCGENLQWSFDESTGTLTISGSGKMYDYYNEEQSQRTPWYELKESILKIVIEDGVTNIGNYAFCGYGSLVDVIIPSSVKSIGSWALGENWCLTNITIPDGVINIGDYAFSGCKNLVNITIPDSVISIGNSTFNTCRSLINITIPDSVKNIGDWAFANCLSLTDIVIPDGVKSIGRYTFWKCNNLAEVTLPDSVTSINDWAFCGCSSLTNITIPNGLTIIGDYAFSECSSLTSITIPNGVTVIGNAAFRECSYLTDIYYSGSQTQWETIVPNVDYIKLPTNVTIHYNTNSFNGHTYQFITGDVSWGEAKQYCEDQGGHLLTITSQEEQDFINQFLYAIYGVRNSRGGSWLGMRCSKTEATWITGEEVTYTNWNRFEPNGDSLGYGIVNRDGAWNDGGEGWSDSKGFICEWDSLLKDSKVCCGQAFL